MSDPIFEAGGIRPYLVEVANGLGGLTMAPQDVLFGTPVLLDPEIVDFDNPERNSQVTLTRPAFEENAEVVVVLNYNRLFLPKLFELRSTEFAVSTETSLTELLTAINARLATRLEAEDILEVSFDPSEPNTLTLQASTNSLYIFGEQQITTVSSVVT